MLKAEQKSLRFSISHRTGFPRHWLHCDNYFYRLSATYEPNDQVATIWPNHDYASASVTAAHES